LIRVSFFRADFSDYIAARVFFEMVRSNIDIANEVEGVGSFYRRSGGVFAFEALT
jgi:hypothetical protein